MRMRGGRTRDLGFGLHGNRSRIGNIRNDPDSALKWWCAACHSSQFPEAWSLRVLLSLTQVSSQHPKCQKHAYSSFSEESQPGCLQLPRVPKEDQYAKTFS